MQHQCTLYPGFCMQHQCTLYPGFYMQHQCTLYPGFCMQHQCTLFNGVNSKHNTHINRIHKRFWKLWVYIVYYILFVNEFWLHYILNRSNSTSFLCSLYIFFHVNCYLKATCNILFQGNFVSAEVLEIVTWRGRCFQINVKIVQGDTGI
jgi:hypothetical protein